MLFIAFLLTLPFSSVYAQNTFLQFDGLPLADSTVDTSINDGHMTPGGLFDVVFDRFGNDFTLGQISVNSNTRRSFSPLAPSSGL